MCTLQGLHYTYLYSGKIIFDTIFANKRKKQILLKYIFKVEKQTCMKMLIHVGVCIFMLRRI